MDNNDKSIQPYDAGKIALQKDETTTLRYSRPVRFELTLTNGTVIDGIIPANSDFKIHLKEGDIDAFDIFIDDVSKQPLSAT